MALNIRKVVAQRAENNQKIYKKDNFYIISIEIFFSLMQELYVPELVLIYFFIADLPLILLALQLVPQPFFEDLVDSHISLIGV